MNLSFTVQVQECIIYNVATDDYVNPLQILQFTFTQTKLQHLRQET